MVSRTRTLCPAPWAASPLALALTLGRAAEDEVKVGRMTIDGARRPRHGFLLFAIQDHPVRH